MKLLHQDGIISGFWATEINPLVPEIVDCGDTQHRYRSRVAPQLHRHWELYYQVAGETKHHAMDGRKFILKPGSVYCAPIFSLDSVHQLERSMSRVLEEATVVLENRNSGLRLALDMLVLDVMRTVSDPVGARSSVAKHPAVLRAIHLMETRFREPWSLNEIADQVEMSRAHFATLFQQNTGISLHKFLTRARISHAKQLLRNSEQSCESIAKECGVTTNFSRAFKLQTGITPIRFRQKYRTWQWRRR